MKLVTDAGAELIRGKVEKIDFDDRSSNYPEESGCVTIN